MDAPRLEVLKALGDNTRYAIYLELARARSPRSTAEIADSLGLHPNTVRPHLERMRDAGLLEVAVDAKGSVGRPQHRYSVSSEAPSLGLEPPAFPILSRMLARLAAVGDVAPADVAEAGAEQGRLLALAAVERSIIGVIPNPDQPPPPCEKALTATLGDLGFDPASVTDGRTTTIAFTHCPYADLAQAHPEVICNLHRGIIEGFVEQIGGAGVVGFRTLTDRDPCQVELAVR